MRGKDSNSDNEETRWEERRMETAPWECRPLCSFCPLCVKPPCLPPWMPTLLQSQWRGHLCQAVCRDFLRECLDPPLVFMHLQGRGHALLLLGYQGREPASETPERGWAPTVLNCVTLAILLTSLCNLSFLIYNVGTIIDPPLGLF